MAEPIREIKIPVWGRDNSRPTKESPVEAPAKAAGSVVLPAKSERVAVGAVGAGGSIHIIATGKTDRDRH